MALLQLVRIGRFRRLLAGAQPAARWLVRPVQQLAEKLQVRRPVTLIVTGIGSPFVWGLGRPKLLWPSVLVDSLPPPCRRTVIAHELAHLRRRDHWVSWLELLAGCVWWWNPLFWYVRGQLRQNAELACDAWVVGTLPEDRRAYAEALIEVTQLVSRTAAPAPAWGMSGGARQNFERRLTMIMGEHVPCKVPLLGLVAAGVLGLAALPGWSQVQVQVRKAEDVKKQDAKVKVEDLVISAVQDVSNDLTIELLNPAEQQQFLTVQLDDELVAQADKSAADVSRDKRLQALEEQIQALLKEVRAMRTGDGKQAVRARVVQRLEKPAVLLQPQQFKIIQDQVKPGVEVKPRQVHVIQPDGPARVRVLAEVLDAHRAGEDGVAVIHLSRATYKLPQAKAAALAGILRELVKAQVLEIKVEGDTLTVTTTPGALKAIGSLVNLIQGKTVAEAESLRRTEAAKVLLGGLKLQLDQKAGAAVHQVELDNLKLLQDVTVHRLKTQPALPQLRLEAEKRARTLEVERKLQELKALEQKIEQLKKEVGQPRKD
jgi:hypothetical protein